jgi:hypothetical protein
MGTRVQHPDGARGTVTGTTRYVTGHMVTRVRWDDGSGVRIGGVTIIDTEGRAA